MSQIEDNADVSISGSLSTPLLGTSSESTQMASTGAISAVNFQSSEEFTEVYLPGILETERTNENNSPWEDISEEGNAGFERPRGQNNATCLLGDVNEEGNPGFKRPRGQNNATGSPRLLGLFDVISSGTFFKCVATVSGLWPCSKRWSLLSIFVSLSLVLFVLLGESVIVFYCKQGSEGFNETFCSITRGHYSADFSSDEFKVYQFLRFLAVATQVLCFIAMSISVRRSRLNSKALPLEQAYKLVKPERWVVVNVQLIGFLTLLITSHLLKICCSKEACGDCDPVVSVFYAVLSIVLWLTIVSCSVFATVINALVILAKECNDQIMQVAGGTINDIIEIHQRFCNTGIQSIKVFHSWFLLSSACYFLLVVDLVIVYLSHAGNTKSWAAYYHITVLFIYSMFAFLHPWLTASTLTSTYSKLTRQLNTTWQWQPNHPFNDRAKLDSFIVYASNTQCQFSQITYSSSLPYISVFLALCGLGLRFFQ